MIPPPAAWIRSVVPKACHVGSRLPHGLPRGKHRHDFAAARGRIEHRRQAFARRCDDGFVAFAELVGDPVDMQMIDSGEAPEPLPRDEADTDCGGTASNNPPTIAMPVDRHRAVHTARSAATPASPTLVNAHHDASAATFDDMIVATQCISSISPVILAAYMTSLPVRLASRFRTSITASKRASNGQ